MTQIEDAIDALYAGAPEDFVPARDALVAQLRADGDTAAVAQVKALRRPTAAAGALNRLAGGTALADLAQLGEQSRAAQSNLDAVRLRRLGSERAAVTQQILDAAQEGSAEPLSAAVREQIVATVAAAVADPAAATAVASGRLTKALSYSGFGEVDLTDAVAKWSSTRQAKPATKSQPRGDDRARTKALAVAEERCGQAESALRSARERLARATEQVTDAERLLADAQAEVTRLRP